MGPCHVTVRSSAGVSSGYGHSGVVVTQQRPVVGYINPVVHTNVGFGVSPGVHLNVGGGCGAKVSVGGGGCGAVSAHVGGGGGGCGAVSSGGGSE